MASFNLNSFKCSPIPSPGGESLKDLIDAGQLTTESLDAPPFVTTTTPTIDEERESPGPEAMDPWNDYKHHDVGRTLTQHHSLVPDIHVAPLAEAIRQSAKDSAAEPIAESPAVEEPMAEAPAVDEEPAETPVVAEEPPNAAEEIVAEALAGAAPAEPVQASNEPPNTHIDCVDDFTFVFQENGKSCFDFLAHMASPAVHANRCIKPTGIVDDKGNELLVKDFCLYSCGTCGDSKWSHMSEPEALMLASEETFVDQMVEGGPTEDSIEAWIDATFGEGSVGSQAP